MGKDEKIDGGPVVQFPGTLRDWFAGMALSDMVRDSYCDGAHEKDIAKNAYGFADAMIAQREI